MEHTAQGRKAEVEKFSKETYKHRSTQEVI